MRAFLILFVTGTILVGMVLARTMRPARPQRRQTRRGRRPATRVRPAPRKPSGGRSSRPRYARTVRCATYEIPSFNPARDAYYGMSVDPVNRIQDHMIKWWYVYVPEGVGVFDGKIKGIKITWHDSEDAAYEYEQHIIGKRRPYFCIEGNFGRGIPGPDHPRAIALHRTYIRHLRKALA